MVDHLDRFLDQPAGDAGNGGPAGLLGRVRLGRRSLLKAGLGASIGALLAACGGDDDDDDGGAATPTANLNAPQPTNVPQPTGQTGGATATTAAAPTATTASAATATTGGGEFQKIGDLTLRTEAYPEYEGTPTDSTDTLRIVRAEDLTSLSPVALPSYSPFTFMYDPALWIDEFSLEVKPWLAEKWEVSADGTTYTLPLRTDVKFHDGSTISAEDVAWSFIAYRDDPDSGVARFFVLMKEDPVAQDASTVVCKLSSTAGDFLANTCNQFIMQKKQFEEYWNTNKTLTGYDFVANPLIGTGQWKQTGYKPDEGVLEMERNADYFQGAPHFEKFVFRSVDNAANRILSWKNDELDLLWPITATDVEQVQDKEAWLYSAYAVAFMNAWINFANPAQEIPDLFKPKAVRHALMHAIDRDGYAEAIFKGFVDQNAYGSICFPWAYTADVPHYEYDPEKALSILAEQGWTKDGDTLKNADGKPFKINAITSNFNQYPVDQIAESVQEDFRQIGIDMSLDKLDAANIRARWRETRDFDLYFVSRILFAGFSDYNYYHSSFNIADNPQGRNSGWISDEGDKLLDQIIREPDLTKQKDLLVSFQKLIADDLPALWFGFPRDLILVRKNILGYQPNAMWQYWDLWKLWKTS